MQVKVILIYDTFSVFQPSAARKANTSVQRLPAPAKPITLQVKTENMDRPSNMRVLLNTRSSCDQTEDIKDTFYEQLKKEKSY